MKEIVKPHGHYPWTDLLDPHGDKPYLVLDQNSGEFYILYWKAHFRSNRWTGSDWYDTANANDQSKPSRKANSWPKQIRVFELPEIEYDPPTIYSCYNHERLSREPSQAK